MATVIKYRGWTLKTFQQKAWPPFKPFTCQCFRKLCMWNVDGSSINQCLALAKERIDDGDTPNFDNFPKLVPCVFE